MNRILFPILYLAQGVALVVAMTTQESHGATTMSQPQAPWIEYITPDVSSFLNVDFYDYSISQTKHELMISANNNILDKDTPQHTFVAGEEITFTPDFTPPLPSGHTGTDADWSFPSMFFGRRANVYEDSSSKHQYAYDEPKTQQTTTDLYCLEDGDKFPTVSMDLTFDNGQTAWVDAHGYFSVDRPTVQTGSQPYPDSGLWHNDPIAGSIKLSPDVATWRLELDSYMMEAEVDGYNGTSVAGDFKWVQLINGTIKSDGATVEASSGWELDTQDPYNGMFFSVNSNDGLSLYLSDGPYVDFNDSASFVADFRAYVMFKPSTAGSIWVPVGVVPWGWTSYAEDTGSSLTLDDSTDMPSLVSPESVALPEWSAVFDPSD